MDICLDSTSESSLLDNHMNITGYSDIEHVTDWDAIKNEIKQSSGATLIVFDVDGVLIDEPNLDEWWWKIEPPKKIIDDEVVELIQNKGLKAYALTHGEWGSDGQADSYENIRINDLNSKGINFSKLSQEERSFQIQCQDPEDGRVHHGIIKDGIIFSREINSYFCMPKGEVLFKVLSELKEKPEKIIFIDDRIYNLEDMQKHCDINNVKFKGFQYEHITK